MSSPPPPPWKCSPSDLDLPNAVPIGAGALSYVLRATHRPTNATVAVKILSKVQLLQQSKVEAVMTEKDCLYALGPHPFIARLLGTAQSDDELYFVMEHLPHGDLLQHIRTVHAERLSKDAAANNASASVVCASTQQRPEGGGDGCTNRPSQKPSSSPRCLDFGDIQLILAQLVVALSHTIRKGYVLRDLKPENICFDSQYRCCLIDFDTVAKDAPLPHTNFGNPIRTQTTPMNKRRKTVSDIQGMRRMTSQFCGTAQYVSPEMVGECCWSYSSDLWALGIIAYQCLYGVYPFKGSNTFSVMKKLVHGLRPEKHFAVEINLEEEGEEEVPSRSSSSVSRFSRVVSFITSLLRLDPTLRLGVNALTLAFDEQQLRAHAIFDGFDWSVVDDEVSSYHFAGAEKLLKENRDDAVATPTSRIAAALHKRPSHSEEYASYVCKSSSNPDINPFEAWAHSSYDHATTTADAATENGNARPVEPTSSDDECYATHREVSTENSNSSDDEDDVEDDVGVQDIGRADPDFQE